jgi:hypothetical protein
MNEKWAAQAAVAGPHQELCAVSGRREQMGRGLFFFWFRPKFTVQVDSSFIYFQKLLFFEELNYV